MTDGDCSPGRDPSATGPRLRTYGFALAPVTAATVVAPVLATLPVGRVALGPLRLLGGLPLVAGLGLAAWGVHSFAAADVVPSPAGTPDRLVTTGALARTRNPVYLGTWVATGGSAVVVESAVAGGYALALALCYHALVVLHEEPALRARAGERYEAYCERVPRWIPR